MVKTMTTWLWICVFIGIILSLMFVGKEERRRKASWTVEDLKVKYRHPAAAVYDDGKRTRTFVVQPDGWREVDAEELEDILASWDLQDHLDELTEEEDDDEDLDQET